MTDWNKERARSRRRRFMQDHKSYVKGEDSTANKYVMKRSSITSIANTGGISIKGAANNSTKARNVKVTLPKMPWDESK